MPVFLLPDEIVFPPPELSERNGLIAIGGDLGVERILIAYKAGIFPWYSEGEPILWWSPDPRLVLFPERLQVARSLRQEIRKATFHVTMDEAFGDVIRGCANAKRGDSVEGGTWITDEMIEAYTALHDEGYAHSIESWHDGQLAGGLYGVSLGSVFYGESMFIRKSNASKVAFVHLVNQLHKWNFTMIDCQMTTRHLMGFGASEITRAEFMRLLNKGLTAPTRRGKWTLSPQETWMISK